MTGPGVSLAGSLSALPCPAGKRTPLGAVTFQLPALEQAQRLELRLAVGEVENTYPLWMYPPVSPAAPPLCTRRAPLTRRPGRCCPGRQGVPGPSRG